MKKMKKMLFLITVLSIFTACAKDKQANGLPVIAPENLLDYVTSKITENPDATISINSDPLGKDFSKPQISILAFLDSKLNNGSAIKEVSLANVKLPRVVDSINNRIFFSKHSDVNNPFGQTVPVNFNTDFFNLQTNFHLPLLVKMNVDSDNDLLSKSKGYTLHWNADTDNGLPIQVSFQYDEFASTFLSPNQTFSKEDIQITKFVKDDGQFSLLPSELAKFPSGGAVRVSISRGSFSFQKSNNKNILLYSLSTDTYPILRVIE
jgi:hypothetical protein